MPAQSDTGLEVMPLYRNWRLLEQVRDALEDLSAVLNVRIPAGNGTRDRQERAQAVDRIHELLKPCAGRSTLPPAWTQLVEKLALDQCLTREIREQAAKWVPRDYVDPDRKEWVEDQTLEQLVQDTKTKLYFVILRNAAIWLSRRGPKNVSWWGYVKEHIPTIVRRAAMDLLGRERERPVGGTEPAERSKFDLLLDASADDPGVNVAREDLAARVRQKLELLDERERFVVECRCVEDRSFGDIAHALGITGNTARTLFANALLRLRQWLCKGGDNL